MKYLIQAIVGSFGYRIVRGDNAYHPYFYILKKGGFEPKHIIDVGAHKGHWTREALKYFPESYYTLIEPQDLPKTHIRDLLARNKKVRWIQAGAADKAGTMPYTVTHRDDSHSFALTVNEAKEKGYHQIDVPVTTLNEVVRESKAPLPDLVKIDAEGFDVRVLAGASDLFGKTEVFILEAAVCGALCGNLENAVGTTIQAMTGAGYSLFDITGPNRSPKYGVQWLCDLAFLRNGSPLLDGIDSYD